MRIPFKQASDAQRLESRARRLRALIGRLIYEDNFGAEESQRILWLFARRPIIAAVLRRVHIGVVQAGRTIPLDPAQAHHVRDVLRLRKGDAVELFDDAGRSAAAHIERCDAAQVLVRVEQVYPIRHARSIVVASALPKGSRADWMIEKLSELGVGRFVPLVTARSIVLPTGSSKRQRWLRIAAESARQSRRTGVMQIDELTPLEQAIAQAASATAFFLSTQTDALPIGLHLSIINHHSPISIFVGPEGGWTEQEISRFRAAGLTAVKLTGTILRVETAAVVAAGIVACAQQT